MGVGNFLNTGMGAADGNKNLQPVPLIERVRQLKCASVETVDKVSLGQMHGRLGRLGNLVCLQNGSHSRA